MISFHTEDVSFRLPDKLKHKQWLQAVAKEEQKKIGELNYVFCSDKYLLEINKQFLDHNFYTDIISFDLSEAPGKLIGEVYISVDRVKENAKTHGASFTEELLRVIFHGALHFCGYKDKKPSDVKKMRQMEDLWLNAYMKL